MDEEIVHTKFCSEVHLEDLGMSLVLLSLKLLLLSLKGINRRVLFKLQHN
jgi:hypothetical protein